MLAQQPSQQPQYADQDSNDAQQLSDELDAADPQSQGGGISVLTGTESIQPARVQDSARLRRNYP